MAGNAVTVAFEVHQAVAVYRCLYDPVVGIRCAAALLQTALLFLRKHFCHRLLFELRMFAFGHIANGLFGQIAVELFDIAEGKHRFEEAFAVDADLTLYLTFLPTGARSTGNRFDTEVIHHAAEVVIQHPLFAFEYLGNGGLQVVINPAPGGSAKESECPIMGIHKHFGSLVRVAIQEKGSAITQSELCQLDFAYFACESDGFGTPIELVCRIGMPLPDQSSTE